MNAVETGRDRLARLREAAVEMEEALQEEGFDRHGSQAVYLRWQRISVEALGAILVEAEKELEERVESVSVVLETARREGEAERRRIERMIEAAANALAFANCAAENAGVASAHAQQMVDELVAGIKNECRRRSSTSARSGLLSSRRRGIGCMHGDWRDGWRLAPRRFLLAAARRTNGGARRKARPVRPCWRRLIAVG